MLQECVSWSVADVTVPIAEQEEDVEADGKQEATKKVTQGCQIWDGEVVWVGTARPQPMHHPHSRVKQNDDLHENVVTFEIYYDHVALVQ